MPGADQERKSVGEGADELRPLAFDAFNLAGVPLGVQAGLRPGSCETRQAQLAASDRVFYGMHFPASVSTFTMRGSLRGSGSGSVDDDRGGHMASPSSVRSSKTMRATRGA